jgi:hypothetical protein
VLTSKDTPDLPFFGREEFTERMIRQRVAVANIYGLGDWLLRGNIGQILLSPDQSKLIYTDDCSNSVCKSLKMLDLNNRETEILYESDIFWIKE